MHIGMGPLYVATWLLYSDAWMARVVCSMIPLAFTVKFAAIGLGFLQDVDAVQTMSRTGDPGELLRGPTLYGVVFVAATLAFWRTAPEGIVAVMLVCGGDGFADVVGRRLGSTFGHLPWSPRKSWAGSAAMLAMGWFFSWLAVTAFSYFGYVSPSSTAPLPLGIIACVATAVESLSIADIDNVSIALAAVAAGRALRAGGLWDF